MTGAVRHGTLRIVNPKLKAALIAGVVAGLAAGSRACVVAIADVDARAEADVAADVEINAPAALIQITDIPAADAGEP